MSTPKTVVSSPVARKGTPGRPRKLFDHQLFSLRLPSGIHRDLRAYALDQNRSLNDILVEVIEAWWARRRPGDPEPK